MLKSRILGLAIASLLAALAAAGENLDVSAPGEAPLPDVAAPFNQAPAAGSSRQASGGTKADVAADLAAAPAAAGEQAAAGGAAAPREGLVVGDAYTLEVTRGDVKRSFGGNLLQANEKWIVLRRIASSRHDYGVPLLSSLPKVGGMFRRSYESLVEDDLWIPREAATIESHHHVKPTGDAKADVGDEPKRKSQCSVVCTQNNKFVRLDGDLTAVTGEKVTVLTTGPFRSPYPRQVKQADILCISIPVVLSNTRTSQREAKGDSAKK